MSGKKCTECSYCKLIDVGYSDYTTEGTTQSCMIDRHPEGSWDRWYGEDWRNHWANWCEYYKEGSPYHLSVEGNLL